MNRWLQAVGTIAVVVAMVGCGGWIPGLNYVPEDVNGDGRISIASLEYRVTGDVPFQVLYTDAVTDESLRVSADSEWGVAWERVAEGAPISVNVTAQDLGDVESSFSLAVLVNGETAILLASEASVALVSVDTSVIWDLAELSDDSE